MSTFDSLAQSTLRVNQAIINFLRKDHEPLHLEDHLLDKHPNNLFFSDNCRVYHDKYLKDALLVIFKGTVYFISKEPSNLEKSNKEVNIKKALIVKPFDIIEDISKVVVPRKQMNNRNQMAM